MNETNITYSNRNNNNNNANPNTNQNSNHSPDNDSRESPLNSQPNKHSYQLRVDSIEDSITESNSREDLIVKSPDGDDEEGSPQQYQRRAGEGLQFPSKFVCFLIGYYNIFE